MESLQCILELKKKLNEYIKVNVTLPQTEKDLIEILPKRLEYFHYILLDILKKSIEHTNQISLIKNEILDNLNKKGYVKEEFHILDTEVFDESNKYLSTLINNFYCYFSSYQMDLKLVNIYYYIFHLIYYILIIIEKTLNKNPFDDNFIKFYVYHIIHIFKKEKKSPEYYFYFYEGAFKLLSKKYNIIIKYIFSLDNYFLPFFQFIKDINSIRDECYNEIVNKEEKNKNDNDYNFISNYRKIKSEMVNILYENIQEINTNDNIDNLSEICDIMKDKIEKVEKVFASNSITSDKLSKYKGKLYEISEIISKNNLTNEHFFLMHENYARHTLNIETIHDSVQKWKKYNNELDQDYTEIFSEIINSKSFQQLYLSAMKSSYVRNFVKKNKLESNYALFIKKYANNIKNYILYVPLTREIKAYVSNYFRIALNINSVELIGNFDENEKLDVYESYLLVQLIHESFHFLYRLDKKDYLCQNALSPIRKKIKQEYGEIGVDIIFFLFGTEYITFFPLENCKLLNSLESWEKDNTDFKVFKQVYLFEHELITDGEKEDLNDNRTGLKCNISLYEDNDDDDSKICADSAIRYCY